MKNFLSVFLKFIAVLLAVAFVITTLASLFLYNIEESAFEPDLYKNALVDENIYDRLPSVIGEQLVTSLGFEVCTQNPIACDLENRDPALEQCLDDTLGSQAYQALVWNERSPTEAELQRVEPCFSEFGMPTAQGEQSELAPFMENLTAKDWELLIIGLIPPDELQQMTESGIDEFFAFLNGEQSQASIPMERIKRRLAGDEGLNAVLRFLKVQ
ncbi:MAG: hypothetical protein L3J16_07050, partial [Anaerolineales bacterium]|nr:hypothetical protein [Anaerolineales bacterium]